MVFSSLSQNSHRQNVTKDTVRAFDLSAKLSLLPSFPFLSFFLSFLPSFLPSFFPSFLSFPSLPFPSFFPSFRQIVRPDRQTNLIKSSIDTQSQEGESSKGRHSCSRLPLQFATATGQGPCLLVYCQHLMQCGHLNIALSMGR